MNVLKSFISWWLCFVYEFVICEFHF